MSIPKELQEYINTIKGDKIKVKMYHPLYDLVRGTDMVIPKSKPELLMDILHSKDLIVELHKITMLATSPTIILDKDNSRFNEDEAFEVTSANQAISVLKDKLKDKQKKDPWYFRLGKV